MVQNCDILEWMSLLVGTFRTDKTFLKHLRVESNAIRYSQVLQAYTPLLIVRESSLIVNAYMCSLTTETEEVPGPVCVPSAAPSLYMAILPP